MGTSIFNYQKSKASHKTSAKFLCWGLFFAMMRKIGALVKSIISKKCLSILTEDQGYKKQNCSSPFLAISTNLC
jgi:hypothetical protein